MLKPLQKRVSLSLLTIVLILAFNGCVTLKPLPVELERFDLATEVSSSEIDGIYDITRLRVGSKAMLRLRSSLLGNEPRLTLVSYELVAIDNATQKFILNMLNLDHKGNGLDTTLEAEPSLIRRVFMSGRVKRLNIYKVDSNQIDPFVMEALWKNVWVGGTLGFALDVIPKLIGKHREKVVTDRYVQIAKEYEDYHKIVKITRMSNEELTIGGRPIECRVYEIETISKIISVGSRSSEPWYIVHDMVNKVWISDDVPFGIVKLDGKITHHLGAEELGVKRKPLKSSVNWELVDFRY